MTPTKTVPFGTIKFFKKKSTAVKIKDRERMLVVHALVSEIKKLAKKKRLTNWNAYMKLTEQPEFKSLMRLWFRHKYITNRDKTGHDAFISPASSKLDKDQIKSFYKNVIVRGSKYNEDPYLVERLERTPKSKYTRRKKR